MSYIRVGVLRGGAGHEKEKSLKIGGSVLRNMPDGYKAYDIFVDKKGDWYFRGMNIKHRDLSDLVDIVFNASHSVDMPSDIAHLTADFEDKIVEAASAFDQNVINNGKRMILAELYAMGMNAQVKYGSETDDSIVYLASVETPAGSATLEVPLDIKRGQNGNVPLFPTIFTYGSNVESFNSQKIQEFMKSVSTNDGSKEKPFQSPQYAHDQVSASTIVMVSHEAADIAPQTGAARRQSVLMRAMLPASIILRVSGPERITPFIIKMPMTVCIK